MHLADGGEHGVRRHRRRPPHPTDDGDLPVVPAGQGEGVAEMVWTSRHEAVDEDVDEPRHVVGVEEGSFVFEVVVDEPAHGEASRHRVV